MKNSFNTEASGSANNIWSAKVFRINALLLVFYFCIRLSIAFLPLSLITIPKWVMVCSQLLFFLIIGGLIITNRKKLAEYNIDHSAVLIFFLFTTVLRLRKIDSVATFVVEVLFIAVAVIVLIFFWKSKKELTRQRFFNKWFFLAVVVGIVLAVLEMRLDPIQNNKTIDGISTTTAIYYFFYYSHHAIGSAGIFEEPVYRGFLWGFLKNIGLSDGQTLVAQAGLFWISHINYIHHPFTIWITTPIMALVLGFLALKSRSIIPPMIAHVTYNAFISVVAL